jgi:hypothetical protein
MAQVLAPVSALLIAITLLVIGHGREAHVHRLRQRQQLLGEPLIGPHQVFIAVLVQIAELHGVARQQQLRFGLLQTLAWVVGVGRGQSHIHPVVGFAENFPGHQAGAALGRDRGDKRQVVIFAAEIDLPG